MKWYILDENNIPVKANSIQEYVDWEEANPTKRIVKQENLTKKIRVSTVFLGLDHAWNGATPLLWETMIFGGKHDDYQERYTSYEDAVEGHKRAVKLAKEK